MAGFLQTPTQLLNTPDSPPHECQDTKMTTRRPRQSGGSGFIRQLGHLRGPSVAAHVKKYTTVAKAAALKGHVNS